MRNMAAPVLLSTYEHNGVEYVAMSRIPLVGSTCSGCCFRFINVFDAEFCTKPLSFNHPNRCVVDGVIYKEKQS